MARTYFGTSAVGFEAFAVAAVVIAALPAVAAFAVGLEPVAALPEPVAVLRIAAAVGIIAVVAHSRGCCTEQGR